RNLCIALRTLVQHCGNRDGGQRTNETKAVVGGAIGTVARAEMRRMGPTLQIEIAKVSTPAQSQRPDTCGRDTCSAIGLWACRNRYCAEHNGSWRSCIRAASSGCT